MGGRQLLFLQLHCREPACGALFFICRPCYRGQRYCSEPCRLSARRRQRLAANRRHQRSDEGRLDHRDRQRAYRLRRAGVRVRVTDQGRTPALSSGTIAEPAPIPGARTARGLVCCVVCGRRGVLIQSFNHRE